MPKVVLPNPNTFKWYEGNIPSQYTPLTGPNLNQQSQQLLVNDAFLMKYINALIGQATDWSAGTTYNTGDIVRGPDKNLYVSLVDNNLNQAVTDSTKWQAVVMSVINDDEVSKNTTWSSKNIQDNILAMSIALG